MKALNAHGRLQVTPLLKPHQRVSRSAIHDDHNVAFEAVEKSTQKVHDLWSANYKYKKVIMLAYWLRRLVVIG